jgi:hypothetical protein
MFFSPWVIMIPGVALPFWCSASIWWATDCAIFSVGAAAMSALLESRLR